MCWFLCGNIGEEEDLDLGKMVREEEVAWLHKADMPSSSHADHAEVSPQQGWRGARQTPHSPDQAASRKRKDPPASRHTHAASRLTSAHPGALIPLLYWPQDAPEALSECFLGP